MKLYTLDSGQRLPALGLGTWKASRGEVYTAVREALGIGYRHIDCAPIYGNEAEVGRAMAEALQAGQCRREDLWVTSKLWNDAHAPEQVQPALEQTLADLRLQFLDLFLIHWPVAFRSGVIFPRRGDDYISLEELPLAATWKAMETCQAKGLVRHIGVSNFSLKKLDNLCRAAAVRPAVNQIELHPFLQQRDMVEYCRQQGILLTAYSPLGSGDRPAGMKRKDEPGLLDHPVIAAIAAKHGATPAQVLLAWGMGRDTAVIPKSVNPARLRENLASADLVLDAQDMADIEPLDRGYRYVDGSFFEGKGSPYTVGDLWAT